MEVGADVGHASQKGIARRNKVPNKKPFMQDGMNGFCSYEEEL